MSKEKSICSPLMSHFKLSSEYCPVSEKEKQEMIRVPYASAVCNLMYAMVCIRPYITYAVGVVSRFLSNPGKEHWIVVKWILIYLRGTSKACLCFGGETLVLQVYTDADMTEDVNSRKSLLGYLYNGAVLCQSKLQ